MYETCFLVALDELEPRRKEAQEDDEDSYSSGWFIIRVRRRATALTYSGRALLSHWLKRS